MSPSMSAPPSTYTFKLAGQVELDDERQSSSRDSVSYLIDYFRVARHPLATMHVLSAKSRCALSPPSGLSLPSRQQAEGMKRQIKFFV